MRLAPQEIRTFFVTSVTAGRRRLFQADARATVFAQVLQENRAKGRFALHAFVVMPDHFHLLVTPAADVSIEKVMQFVKGGFSFRLRFRVPVWEQSFAMHRVEDGRDYEAHRVYIEENPVKAGICGRAAEFGFSSACGRWAVDGVPPWFRG